MAFNFTDEEKQRFFVILDKADKHGRSLLINYFCSLGFLDTIIWLQENGSSWNKWTIACAAQGGDLELVKWLIENGCPWNEYTIAFGHLEVAKWLKESLPYKL